VLALTGLCLRNTHIHIQTSTTGCSDDYKRLSYQACPFVLYARNHYHNYYQSLVHNTNLEDLLELYAMPTMNNMECFFPDVLY
jgi:hypothetical protein